jgi:hypothetical protein
MAGPGRLSQREFKTNSERSEAGIPLSVFDGASRPLATLDPLETAIGLADH